jgi:hypothetical protein
MSISCIKTITGEDIIGDITEHAHGVDVETPLMVVVVPTQQGQYNVGLAPYMMFSSQKKFTFKKEHVIMQYDPADELRNEYNRITGKGIIVSTPKIELVP